LAINDAGATTRLGGAVFLLCFFSRHQQRNHLERLAEAHVVGKEASKTEGTQQPEPTQTMFLIRTKLRLERGTWVDVAERARIAELDEKLTKPRPRFYAYPRRRVSVGKF
jgi:hypothetical protein